MIHVINSFDELYRSTSNTSPFNVGGICVHNGFGDILDEAVGGLGQSFEKMIRQGTNTARKKAFDLARGAANRAGFDILDPHNGEFTKRGGGGFIGNPDDPAPESWTYHINPGNSGNSGNSGGNNKQTQDQTSARNGYYNYGGPVRSLYSAINGLDDTVTHFIDKTRDAYGDFAQSLTYQAQQIRQYILYLSDPVVRQGFDIKTDDYAKMLGQLRDAVKQQKARLSEQYIAPLKTFSDILRPLAGTLSQPYKYDPDLDRTIKDMRGTYGGTKYAGDPRFEKLTEAADRAKGKQTMWEPNKRRSLTADETKALDFFMRRPQQINGKTVIDIFGSVEKAREFAQGCQNLANDKNVKLSDAQQKKLKQIAGFVFDVAKRYEQNP